MKAIIIDDEEKGRKILQSLLGSYCKDVTVAATAGDADEAYTLILKHKPDVIFLDIEMPNGNGFSLLERFDEIPFHVIFTTAYDSYAIKAIKYHALDYLLKPIDIDELKLAVEKIKTLRQTRQPENRYFEFLASRKLEFTGRIGLPIKEGVVFMPVSDIVWIESDGNYCTFHTMDSKKYVVSKNIGEYEELLPCHEFFRAHKSHLINVKKVKKYIRTDGYYVEMEDGAMVEIARRKKDEFLNIMKDLH
jgi:two-component system LytT family response regulator